MDFRKKYTDHTDEHFELVEEVDVRHTINVFDQTSGKLMVADQELFDKLSKQDILNLGSAKEVDYDTSISRKPDTKPYQNDKAGAE